MSERCKNCRNNLNSGIWLSPEFNDEKVFLFCDERCKKEFLKMKLERIRVDYPSYYDKIKSGKIKSIYWEVLESLKKIESELDKG